MLPKFREILDDIRSSEASGILLIFLMMFGCVVLDFKLDDIFWYPAVVAMGMLCIIVYKIVYKQLESSGLGK